MRSNTRKYLVHVSTVDQHHNHDYNTYDLDSSVYGGRVVWGGTTLYNSSLQSKRYYTPVTCTSRMTTSYVLTADNRNKLLYNTKGSFRVKSTRSSDMTITDLNDFW